MSRDLYACWHTTFENCESSREGAEMRWEHARHCDSLSFCGTIASVIFRQNLWHFMHASACVYRAREIHHFPVPTYLMRIDVGPLFQGHSENLLSQVRGCGRSNNIPDENRFTEYTHILLFEVFFHDYRTAQRPKELPDVFWHVQLGTFGRGDGPKWNVKSISLSNNYS